jgi:hypothetical protein
MSSRGVLPNGKDDVAIWAYFLVILRSVVTKDLGGGRKFGDCHVLLQKDSQ